MGVVVRRYIDYLILLIPTPLVSFSAASLLFVHFKNVFVLFIYTCRPFHSWASQITLYARELNTKEGGTLDFVL